jgi:hypothetical protein
MHDSTSLFSALRAANFGAEMLASTSQKEHFSIDFPFMCRIVLNKHVFSVALRGCIKKS